MTSVQIAIINKSPHQLPEYATTGSSGMDIRAWVNEDIILKPLERQLIATGIYVEIPEGYEIQVRPRSGLAYKQGITCLNTPGTIDSDYRGEIKVLLINLSDEIQAIHNGDRIAQLVVAKTEKAIWLHAEQINETDRGDGGFGHTGKK
jgi:dUTP pyrophosphatase